MCKYYYYSLFIVIIKTKKRQKKKNYLLINYFINICKYTYKVFFFIYIKRINIDISRYLLNVYLHFFYQNFVMRQILHYIKNFLFLFSRST